MPDPLLRLAELLGAVAERLVMVEIRLIEAIGALDARLKRGGERAGKAERATAETLSRLATAEAVADLRSAEQERHAEIMQALARVEARIGAVEARPAPATWADVFGRHPALIASLIAVLAALAGWLGGSVPGLPVKMPEPTAIMPGAGSRLHDRRVASGGEG